MAGVVLPLRSAASRVYQGLTMKMYVQNVTRLLSSTKPIVGLGPGTIQVSDSCISRLRELGKSTTLRVGVDGGGCSGFQYQFELDTPIEDNDHVFTKDGVSVIVDESSMQYLRGATIEYHKELIRSAFRIVNNPLAEQGCSCGASFNIKVPEG